MAADAGVEAAEGLAQALRAGRCSRQMASRRWAAVWSGSSRTAVSSEAIASLALRGGRGAPGRSGSGRARWRGAAGRPAPPRGCDRRRRRPWPGSRRGGGGYAAVGSGRSSAARSRIFRPVGGLDGLGEEQQQVVAAVGDPRLLAPRRARRAASWPGSSGRPADSGRGRRSPGPPGPSPQPGRGDRRAPARTPWRGAGPGPQLEEVLEPSPLGDPVRSI